MSASQQNAVPQVPYKCRCQGHPTPIHQYWYSWVESGIIRLFLEHHVFEAIPQSGEPISIPDLATATSASPALLTRLTNFLVAAEVLSAPSHGQVAHTDYSQMFLDKRASTFFAYIFDFQLKSEAHWPEYFARGRGHGLVEPASASEMPLGLAWGHPDKTYYQILEAMPETAEAFNRTMAVGLDGMMPILGMYDFSWVGEYAAGQAEPGRTLIVDVGGGMGQALKAIIGEVPQIPAERCVLEDRPDVIEKARQAADDGVLRGVKMIGTSFFDEQPEKGALIYHVRRCLNDWPDEDAVKILSNVREACAPDSKVLVSEQLLPETPHLGLAALDIFMMNTGGKRRPESLYRELASRAGLKVVAIHRDTKGSASAVIEMVLV